jgi:murein DD-endopeptidase MepM/ murein hydrolase activator NlpD
MRHAYKVALCGLAATATLGCAASAAAAAGPPGGTAAPAGAQAGGSEFTTASRRPPAPRPVVSELAVPRTAPAGRPPRVTLRIDETGVGSVAARVTVTDLTARRNVLVLPLGWIRTGRTTVVKWPRGATLRPGSYHVSLAARDRRGATLLRRARASGVATLTVLAPAPPAAPPSTPATPTPVPEAGVPTPAETVTSGAVFPVAGAHSFGGADARFGAPRGNHTHQGQDVMSAEGTPVLAPLAGTVTTTSYQAGGAGYYAVVHTATFDFFFAHCQAGSLAVATGQPVSAGQGVCSVGKTGDASGSHLHFEMWVGGWHASASSRPIDPLPYLEAWERRGA